MKPKVWIAREVFEEVLQLLGRHFEVEANQQDRLYVGDELAHKLADKEGALLSISDRVDRALLERCPKLRAVCNIAVGYNNIDVPECTRRGILVTNTPGILEETTADLGMALLLAAARHVVQSDRWVREGRWDGWKLKQWLGIDVHDATLGIFGMGRIGKAIARRACGFSMDILYHNRNPLPEALARECGARYVSKEELLRESDFVVVTMPYTPQNHHFIGAPELALMKPGAMLVNIARGGLVDDAALVAALKDRRIAGAGLDVFESEPALHPEFAKLDNVVLTPHIGSASRATRLNMAMLAAQNLVAALNSADPPNLVNTELRGVRR